MAPSIEKCLMNSVRLNLDLVRLSLALNLITVVFLSWFNVSPVAFFSG